MAYLNWTDSFSVNVRVIDEQHKTLVGMINDLHDALQTNRGAETQKRIIGDMVRYATVHFQTEEKYMRQFHFPDYPSHRAEHERFSAKALELQERSENNGFILTLEIISFLKQWLQNHILGTDAGYTQHFNENGLY